MNHELLILFLLTVSLIVLLVLMLGYLIIRKAIDRKRRKVIENVKKEYNPLIFQLITNGSRADALNPKKVLEKKAIEELLSRYSKILEGEKERKHLSELAGTYLTDYYRKRLKGKKWSTRMNTLYHIEDFRIVQLKDDIFRLINKKRLSHEELVHALRILGLFQFNLLFELLTQRYHYLSEYEYRYILIYLEQAQFEKFVVHFEQLAPSLKHAILDVISIKKGTDYHSFLEEIFLRYSGEVKLRALKALAEIGQVENIDPYLELLYSTKWEERMVATKLVGALKVKKAVPRLMELLHDQTWWVRSQAGQAICQFTDGKDILRAVFETSKDPFAKDMAWEWLHKGV